MSYRSPTLAGVSGLMVAVAMMLAASGPPSAARAGFRQAAVPATELTPFRQVLLITGDRVLVVPPGTGSGPGIFVPAAHSGLAASVLSLTLGGNSYDVPPATLPYLGHGLDPRLFDVTRLLAAEAHGRLPVQVSYQRKVPALPGITLTRASGGTAHGYLTAASARVFGAALDRQYLADHPRASYGTDGMFAAGTTVSLPGSVPAAPARSPLPMRTLTVKATNLAGTPDTGDLVLAFNVDDTSRVDPFYTGTNVFYHGVAKYSLPVGHYWVVGGFFQLNPRLPGAGIRLVVLPQITVAANRAVTLRETAANSEITMTTPRPATVLTTGVWLSRTGAAGPPFMIHQVTWGIPVWLSPTTARPSAGTMQVSVNQHLESPPSHGAPYEYTLSYTNPPGSIPAQHYQARPGDLATVHERFYQAVHATGLWGFGGVFPGTNPVALYWFGWVEALGPSLTFPGTLTEYVGSTGTARMMWGGVVIVPSGDTVESGARVLLHPGQQLTQNWGAFPLHPAPNAALQREVSPSFWDTVPPSAVRAGNTLRLAINLFDDNQPGDRINLAPSQAGRITGSYQIDQNGIRIAGGDATKRVNPLFGWFQASAGLTGRPAMVRVSLDLAQTGTHYPLGTATRTVWAWRTTPRTGTLPPNWTCQPLTRTRHCAVEPMLTLYYHVLHMALADTVPAGQQTVRLLVGHLQLAAHPAITHVTVLVSLDGGKTWRPANVTGRHGSYAATFTAPPGDTVSLRTIATDTAGGSITETITNAYRTAP